MAIFNNNTIKVARIVTSFKGYETTHHFLQWLFFAYGACLLQNKELTIQHSCIHEVRVARVCSYLASCEGERVYSLSYTSESGSDHLLQ